MCTFNSVTLPHLFNMLVLVEAMLSSTKIPSWYGMERLTPQEDEQDVVVELVLGTDSMIVTVFFNSDTSSFFIFNTFLSMITLSLF